jgi:protocatechuate 3,4-dioxygenase beta subunit
VKKDLKRTLTSIAAASMALGMLVPVAFASSTTSGLAKAGQLPIVVNGSVLSNPYEMTGKDSGNTTGFFPIYYFNQALSQLGFTATWDGVNHVWAVTAPGVTPTAVAGGVGTSNTTVTVNGTVVKKFNTQAAKDPAGSQVTTYLPIFYIQNVLSALGVKGNFSGQTGLSVTKSVATVAPALTNLSVSGETVGTGSKLAPASAQLGTAMTLSTTLTDANGNPVAGTQVTFNVYSSSSTTPTVTVNGNPVNYDGGLGNSNSPFTYQVSTNAQGKATVTINAAGSAAQQYTVYVTAPYSDFYGNSIKTGKAYLQWGTAGGVIIAPVTDTVPFGTASNPSQGLVPVTATVLPGTNNTNVAGVPVTFTLTTSGSAKLVDSTGATVTVGNTYTVKTDSNGVATVYVTDPDSTDANASATVKASYTDATGTTQTSTTANLAWGGIGSASKTNKLSVVNANPTTNAGQYTATMGDNVTISGQLQDANGNAVSNTQLLINQPDGNGSFVNGSTATGFSSSGANLTNDYYPSTYGEVITTDANGNFSFTVTDSDFENDDYVIYGITNGQVGSKVVPNPNFGSTYVDDIEIDWQHGTTVQTIGVDPVSYNAGVDNYNLAGATYGSSNPIPTTATFQSPITTSGTFASGNTNGAEVEFVGFNGKTPLTGQNVSYTATTTVGSIVGVAVNGTATGGIATGSTVSYMPIAGGSGVSTVNIQESYSGSQYTVTVNGTQVAASSSSVPVVQLLVLSKHTGTGTLTVSNGKVSATANITLVSNGNVGGGKTVATPSVLTATDGAQQTVTLTAQDANGNALANSKVTLDGVSAGNVWLTGVNGVALSSNIGPSNSSEPTPIPLYAMASNAPQYNVAENGIVSWNHPGLNAVAPVSLYTDAKGQVTLTLSNDNVTYWGSTIVDTAGSVYTSNGSGTNFVLYTSGSAQTVYLGTSLPGGSTIGGQINW